MVGIETFDKRSPRAPTSHFSSILCLTTAQIHFPASVYVCAGVYRMCLCAWVTVEIAHESLSLCVNVCKWLCVLVSLHACVNCALLTRISVCMFWICSYIHVCVFFSVTSVIVHMTVCIFFCLCTCVCVHSYQWVYVFVCMCVFIYVFVLVSWMLCLGYETVYTGSGFKRHGHLWSLFWEMWNPWHCGFTRRHGCQWDPPLGLPWALSFLIHQMQTRSGTSSYKHQH